jgi:hypothetical protein
MADRFGHFPTTVFSQTYGKERLRTDREHVAELRATHFFERGSAVLLPVAGPLRRLMYQSCIKASRA